MELFECKICGKTKPKEEFSKDKNYKYGITKRCKKCDCLKTKKWRKNNPEKNGAIRKRYGENNREKIKEYQREYYVNNAEKRKGYSNKYYRNNSEKCKENNKKYRQNNTEKCKGYRINLVDHYIIGLLTVNTNINKDVIRQYPELIELKRLIIKNQRLCKTLQN